MSASPMARQISENKAIPTRRVVIGDASEIPCSYSSTPGGTLFSTTPGGTRIVYEKAFLMNLRNSPISKTPPQWDIPASILRGSPKSYANNNKQLLSKKSAKYEKGVANGKPPRDDHFEQFQMDM